MTLSAHDELQISRFEGYLADLYSSMSPEEFARKWAEYLGLDLLRASKYKEGFDQNAAGRGLICPGLPKELPKIAGIHYPLVGGKPEAEKKDQ